MHGTRQEEFTKRLVGRRESLWRPDHEMHEAGGCAPPIVAKRRIPGWAIEVLMYFSITLALGTSALIGYLAFLLISWP